MQEESPSLTSVGTNGRLFCFQPNCGPLLAAGWVCTSSFGGSSGALADVLSNVSGRGVGREGKKILAFQNDTDRRRKTDHPQQPQSEEAPRSRKKRGANSEVGQALRAAYQQAVSENIPPEMLDLLGKLG